MKRKKEKERKKPNINLWSIYIYVYFKKMCPITVSCYIGMREINIFFENHAIEFSVGSLYDQEFINLKFR